MQYTLFFLWITPDFSWFYSMKKRHFSGFHSDLCNFYGYFFTVKNQLFRLWSSRHFWGVPYAPKNRKHADPLLLFHVEGFPAAWWAVPARPHLPRTMQLPASRWQPSWCASVRILQSKWHNLFPFWEKLIFGSDSLFHGVWLIFIDQACVYLLYNFDISSAMVKWMMFFRQHVLHSIGCCRIFTYFLSRFRWKSTGACYNEAG